MHWVKVDMHLDNVVAINLGTHKKINQKKHWNTYILTLLGKDKSFYNILS